MKTRKILIFALFLCVPLIVYGSCGHCSGNHSDAKFSKAECKDGKCATKSGNPSAKIEKPAEDRFIRASDPSINVPALETLINLKVPLTLCDARSGKYDDGNRIPGALALNDRSSLVDVRSALPDKERLVVTYCVNLQCPASHNLFLRLKKLGYKNVVELPEGIEGWVKAGHQVKKIN